MAAAALLGSLGTSQADDAPRCGAPGKPPCPLQRWMRHQLAAPLAKADHAALASAFRRLSELNPEPDEWNEWNELTERGRRAAEEGNIERAHATCGSCHRKYRRRYLRQHRTRPIGG